MKKIGLTGGIGSGKSTVAKIFEAFGFKVWYADDRAKALLASDPGIHSALRDQFGSAVFDASGKPDRKKIAALVFSNKEALDALNSIIHPRVAEDWENWLNALESYPKPFVLREAAILFEAGAAAGLDGVIEVYAPKELRLARVMARDSATREQVLSRMANQWPEDQRLRRADFVIWNDGEHHLIPQAENAIRFFESR